MSQVPRLKLARGLARVRWQSKAEWNRVPRLPAGAAARPGCGVASAHCHSELQVQVGWPWARGRRLTGYWHAPAAGPAWSGGSDHHGDVTINSDSLPPGLPQHDTATSDSDSPRRPAELQVKATGIVTYSVVDSGRLGDSAWQATETVVQPRAAANEPDAGDSRAYS